MRIFIFHIVCYDVHVDGFFEAGAEVKCVRMCFTLILAQASCVDSVPLSSFTSMEPRYCRKDTNKHI